jgi:hypothetical protein
MSVDSSSAVTALESGTVEPTYSVSMLRKAQDAQRLQGEAAVRLIDASNPQMVKTADGHISVRA